MPTKTNKKRTTKAKSSAKTQVSEYGCNPLVWTIAGLFLALICVSFAACVEVKNIKREAVDNLQKEKVEVFDELAQSFINELEFSEHKTTQQITGYGVSSEDGVFYITFSYYDLEENPSIEESSQKYGVIYFWKDEEHGGYSHAFSYHDEDYHPEGRYVEK